MMNLGQSWFKNANTLIPVPNDKVAHQKLYSRIEREFPHRDKLQMMNDNEIRNNRVSKHICHHLLNEMGIKQSAKREKQESLSRSSSSFRNDDEQQYQQPQDC